MALTLVVAGFTANRAVNAQDATPSAGTGTTETETANQTSAYDEFVAGLAANLGIADVTTVDIAIKETLKQIVDQKFANGEISANQATAMKERIDAGEIPFGLGGFGPRGDGLRGHDGRGGLYGPKADRDTDTDDDATTPSTEATPTTEATTSA
jgi:hypothetical protein